MRKKGSIFLSGPLFPILLVIVIIVALMILYTVFFQRGSEQTGAANKLFGDVFGAASKCSEIDPTMVRCIGVRSDKNPDSENWDGCPEGYAIRVPFRGCDTEGGYRCCAKQRDKDICASEDTRICAKDSCPVNCGTNGGLCDGVLGLGPGDDYDYVLGSSGGGASVTAITVIPETHPCAHGCPDCLGLKGDQASISIINCPRDYPFRVPSDIDGKNLDDYCPDEGGVKQYCCQN